MVIQRQTTAKKVTHLTQTLSKSSQNKPDDSDPNHWDIALDLSGLDFYAQASGSYVTMGLAPVTGKAV